MLTLIRRLNTCDQIMVDIIVNMERFVTSFAPNDSTNLQKRRTVRTGELNVGIKESVT